MIKYFTLDHLDDDLKSQYSAAVKAAFPPVNHQSPIVKEYWARIEKYFPKHQIFAIDENHTLVGSINTIPIHWDKDLDQLPNDGWDWLVKKGISDFENNIKPNSLGGLQIIVPKNFQGRGHSKLMIAQAKNLKEKFKYENLFIPIRPTFKHLFPEMKMHDYMLMKKDERIYDPWIRTHLNSGAQIINVCSNSMNIKADLTFWENQIDKKIKSSGNYVIPGALSQIKIDIEKNVGEYKEPNIWINYPQ